MFRPSGSIATYLIKRGYNRNFVNKQIRRAADIPRQLTLQTKDINKPKRIPFITTFNPSLPRISHIIKKHFNLLLFSNRCKKNHVLLSNLFSSSNMLSIRLFLANTWKNRGLPGLFPLKLPWNVVIESEITLRTENWRGGDWDETKNGAHVMRRKGCAMQNKGITLTWFNRAPVAQLVEHRVIMLEAVSSTTAGPTLRVLK